MLKLDQFESVINAFRKQNEIDIIYAHKLAELSGQEKTSDLKMYNNTALRNSIAELLSVSMNLTPKNKSILETFIFEHDCGVQDSFDIENIYTLIQC